MVEDFGQEISNKVNSRNILKEGYWEIICSLTRLGLFPFLMIFVALFIIACFDIGRYITKGPIDLDLALGLKTAWLIFKTKLPQSYYPLGKLTLFFITLPILCGVANVQFGFISGKNIINRRSSFLITFYIFLAMIIALFYLFAKSMEFNSGHIIKIEPEINDGYLTSLGVVGTKGFEVLALDKSFEFNSLFAKVMELIFPLMNYFAEIIFFLVPLVVTKFDNFFVKTWLVDKDCYPFHSQHFLNFNSADTAPVIRFIGNERESLLNEYASLPPRTVDSKNWIMKYWGNCQDQLLKLIGLASDLDRKQIRLFDGTGRALETTLDHYPFQKKVILSPYETPTIKKICKWYEVSHSCRIDYLDRPQGFLETPKEKQITTVVNGIINSIEIKKTNIVIISEVCYATGLTVELEDIIVKVKIDCEKKGVDPPRYIIIGSYAVENLLENKGSKLGDAYIFNGDKWLMAPEPCGIVIINNMDFKLKPYDCLDNEISTTNFDHTKVAGLKSCLDLLFKFDNLNKKFFTHRSHEMLSIFWPFVKDHFVIVGETTQLKPTRMISLKPNEDNKWKFKKSKELDSYLMAKEIIVKIIEIEEDLPWVRLSFSFFHTNNDVKKLGKVLLEAIEPIHTLPSKKHFRLKSLSSSGA